LLSESLSVDLPVAASDRVNVFTSGSFIAVQCRAAAMMNV